MNTFHLVVFASVAATFFSGGAPSADAAVGPDYRPPTNEVPSAYKAADLGAWKEGRPLDDVPKGNWWEVFADSALDDLESQAVIANQELKAAVARVDQARATARVARSELLPSLTLEPGGNRQRFSPNQVPSFGPLTANTFRAPLDLSYEIDLWGRVRRGFESGTVGLRQEQVRLVRSRFEGGIGSELDVARAETELATTEAEAASLAQRRAELENAIAILVGGNPSSFRISALATNEWNPQPPGIPAGLPAELLERRPDVAEAERQLASANARIGVAKAAFFPVLSLTSSGGFVSGDIDSLFKWDSRTWSIGPSLSLPIFAGGRNRANYKRSQAAFEEAIARYRQRVLVAFGEVENSLAGIRYLTDQAAAQQRAVANARRAAELATDRYRSGIVSYLEVVDASRDALQTERANAQLAGQRLITTVHLIRALGGGWREDLRQASTGPSISRRR